VLQCVAVCCSVLQYATVCCYRVLHGYRVLQRCIWCIVLRRVIFLERIAQPIPQKSPISSAKEPYTFRQRALYLLQKSPTHFARLSLAVFRQRHNLCCSGLQCVAVSCSVLQCVTVCCSVVSSVAACDLSREKGATRVTNIHINVLQYVAVHEALSTFYEVCCSVLQCVAVCCSVVAVCSHFWVCCRVVRARESRASCIGLLCRRYRALLRNV